MTINFILKNQIVINREYKAKYKYVLNLLCKTLFK